MKEEVFPAAISIASVVTGSFTALPSISTTVERTDTVAASAVSFTMSVTT